jgi:uncharacterized protein
MRRVGVGRVRSRLSVSVSLWQDPERACSETMKNVSPSVTLDVVPGSYAICRLNAAAAAPAWAAGGPFSSITRTAGELSIVCSSDAVPADVEAQRGYRALAVRGPLDFSLIGVVAQLSTTLAAAAISIFVVSTHDTDYVFVPGEQLERAITALRGAGQTVVNDA